MFTTAGRYRKAYTIYFQKIKKPDEDEVPAIELANRIEENNVPLTESQLEALRSEAPSETVDCDGFQRIITSTRAQKSKTKRFLYQVSDLVATDSQKIENHAYINAYTWCPPPIFILSITAIQVAIFFFYYSTDGRGSVWTDCSGCFVHHNHSQPGIFIFTPSLRYQAWRFGSYMFLHSGLTHLLSNCVIQLCVGFPLEAAHKLPRILFIYTIGVVAGSLLQYLVDPSTMLVGASAGVYALIFSHVANVLLMPFRWVRVAFLSVFITFDFYGVIHRRYILKLCDSISYWAHFAGAITGLFLGYSILYNIVKHRTEKILRLVALGGYTLFFVILIFSAIFRRPYSIPWDSCQQ